MSSSASGLSGAEGLGDGDALAEGEGEEAAGEEEEGGGADDFDRFAGGDDSLAVGVGEAFPNGFTGPVGFSGAAGVGLAADLGEGEGEGAARALESGRQKASAKMKERNLMKLRWIGRSAGRCPRSGCAANLYIEVAGRHSSIHRGNLRRRFARCQNFPHGRSSFRPERDFS